MSRFEDNTLYVSAAFQNRCFLFRFRISCKKHRKITIFQPPHDTFIILTRIFSAGIAFFQRSYNRKRNAVQQLYFFTAPQCPAGNFPFIQYLSIRFVRGKGGRHPIIINLPYFRIGKNSNIQDNAVLHTGPNLGVTIGKNVSIGHSAVVHGCTVGDGALIGMHATVLNGAVVGKNAVVAAGALVLENTVVPDGMVAMGVPAKVREAASPALVEANRKNAEGYVAEATAHAEANK